MIINPETLKRQYYDLVSVRELFDRLLRASIVLRALLELLEDSRSFGQILRQPFMRFWIIFAVLRLG